MKKMNIKIWAGALLVMFSAASCNDFLDINTNPNLATTADVDLVLPQSIVGTAARATAYNNYGAHFGGFMANAGGFSGFGTLFNYNLVPGDYNGLWTGSYTGPLADLKYVIDFTEEKPEFAFHNAAAKIMTAVNYQWLVDAFGDVAYTEALDPSNPFPAYDDAATVYADLIAKLDEAIAKIDANPAANALSVNADPLFGKKASVNAQMLEWKRYANTLKLRMLIRTNGNLSTVAKTFTANLDKSGGDVSAFLSDDAVVNPGYEKARPNPDWNTWGLTNADQPVNRSRVPTDFAFGFYGGAKLTDTGRGAVSFVDFTASPRKTPFNQLGDESRDPATNSAPSDKPVWTSNATGLSGTGIIKGFAAGRPLMLLAEAKFLLAEAELKGADLTDGDAASNFEEGITASFTYLYKTPAGTLAAGADIAGLVAAYKAENESTPNERLVNFDLATTDAQKLEAIITQKYIALNMINSEEAYNEFRRTGFPVTVAGGAPALNIASRQSAIVARPDRLPTRVMYPSSEQQLNPGNYRNVDYTSERIFWDPN